MTRAEIADLVTRKLQRTDTDTLALAKDFVTRRYEMIWDECVWRDSLMTESQSVTEGTSTVLLDNTMDFPVAVRWEKHEVLPIDHETVFKLDPEVFERTGTPMRFIRLSEVSGQARIQLLEKPDKDGTLLILGKEKITPMNEDGDSPRLHGVTNTLIAFVEHDLLQYDRQFGKAQVKQQEASALLTKMQHIESYQEARIQQIIPVEQGIHGHMSDIGYR